MKYALLISMLIINISVFSQKDKKEVKNAYQFTDKVRVKDSPVKNQQRSGTCWSYATTSFLETELIRTTGKTYDLSEMYFVNLAYQAKANDYVRCQGKANFSEGGQAHDVMNAINIGGLLPESVYSGLEYGSDFHNHSEMEAVMKAMLNVYVSNPNKKLSTVWFKSVKDILSNYLGEIPEKFSFEEKEYTPMSLVKELKINTTDYIEFTSFNHKPYYEKFMLKIPDNWSKDLYYNLPLDEFMRTIDNALEKGYSVCWDGDVSEANFSFKNGVAIVPKEDWFKLDKKEQEEFYNKINEEIKVNQESRQENYDNLTTTDDHLMHIVGYALDQKGNKYYITKNSWGDKSNLYDGYLYMSESYVKLKTIAYMIHKDAIPEDIAKKLK